MVRWPPSKRFGPIGVDLGRRSVKLVQFDDQHTRLIDAIHWDLRDGDGGDDSSRENHLYEALTRGRNGRGFRGKEAVVCLGDDHLLVQNLRVPKATGEELTRSVYQEAAGRIPYPIDEAEIRYLETTDVRQGDSTMREVIVFAYQRPLIEHQLDTVVRAGLRPIAVDVQPAALLRCYARQCRRDEDRRLQSMLVHVGTHKTVVVIADGENLMFVKHIDVGGAEMDAAVARNLDIGVSEAAALRARNANRRDDQQDREVTRSVNESIRPVIARLSNELSMCVRYHSVTFRREPVSRVMFGGGEASRSLVDSLSRELEIKCELGDPFHEISQRTPNGRVGRWDVAAGLALREVN